MPPLSGHLDTLETLGISYDSTYGSNYYFGYVYGTGKPYFLRHPGAYQLSDILEFPLHVMDSVFIEGFGREWGRADPFALIRSFMDEALVRHHSLMTVNFHHYFLLHPDRKINNRDLYEQILDYGTEKGIKFVNLTLFNRFWRNRSRVKIDRILWTPSTGTLCFTIETPVYMKGLTWLLPARFKNRCLAGSTMGKGKKITLNARSCYLFQTDLEKGEALVVTAWYH
jgi:hypothetical protein